MEKQLSEMALKELWELFPIVLKEYNPQYNEWYEIEKQSIFSNINADNIARINHIGSSAVVGLISKPTVDILLEVVNDCDILRLIDDLIVIGWGLMKKQDEPIKLTFNKGYTPNGFADKVYHLHVRYSGDWEELYFRDYLIEHADVANEYGILKLNLLKDFEHDRDGYTEAKSEFILKYSEMAKRDFQGKYKPQ
ncbi:MAG: GrpB family protein [Oscillospiraceae bacterium]|nr:GrpB family protein [Oscillospiraceae bacterium]